MNITIYFEATSRREVVILHAWEPVGRVWDIDGVRQGQTRIFRFDLETDTIDLRNISFIYRFPRENSRWETDDYIRFLPGSKVKTVWTFDYSSRCVTISPYEGTAPEQVVVHVITENRFSGGELIVWKPDEGVREQFPQTFRNEEVSDFIIPVRDWMRDGFHFKLMSDDGDYEPDRINRVWRPGDGSEIWIKSGQVSLYPAKPEQVETMIEVIYPRSLPEKPGLHIKDVVDDYVDTAYGLVTDYDEVYLRSIYTLSLYPCAIYFTEIRTGDREPLMYKMPYYVPPDMPLAPSCLILGFHEWLERVPQRNAPVKITVHPDSSENSSPQIALILRVGEAPEKTGSPSLPVSEILPAARQSDGTWTADFKVFPGVPHWLDLLTSPDGKEESRIDGPFWSMRNLKIPAAGAAFHTVYGISGLAKRRPDFCDLSYERRRDLMGAAYSQAIVSACVFNPWEMPHGCVIHEKQVWFTLYAPHGVTAELLILSPQGSVDGKRSVKKYRMNLTSDLRYWWHKLPLSEAPFGTCYRFLLNDEQEIIDPASRLVTENVRLWAKPGEDIHGPWSRVPDPEEIGKCLSSPWQTPSWDSFLIYELHPLRLTRDHVDASGKPLSAFRQILCELEHQGYLAQLGVTALEFLPVHEFPGNLSWGYNPSLFFAIETFYGGPYDFAECVDACHDRGKAVMLDIVFNHMVESPLQAVAPDVYTDGKTCWGDMVNYDHPVAMEFFRQALVYLWHTFCLDGFRFDATEAIINGDKDNIYIIKNKRTGSGGGRDFLDFLRKALRDCADAEDRSWPYLVGENIPTNWAMTGSDGVLDGQWDFDLHFPLSEAAVNGEDRTWAILDSLKTHRPFYETVRFVESHDSVSGQEEVKQRIARRESHGLGLSMAKAQGAFIILARGVPMFFMGEEAGEDRPFLFGMDDLEDRERFLSLRDYRNPDMENNKIFTWFQHLMGLRNNPLNGLRGEDSMVMGAGNRTLAFTRAEGRFFVMVTFGTDDRSQDVGRLGLPDGVYKEIFNSTWSLYRVGGEVEVSNGGYGARIGSGDVVSLPYIGAVVLERRG